MKSRTVVLGLILAACLSLALLMWLKATKSNPGSRGVATAPGPGGISPQILGPPAPPLARKEGTPATPEATPPAKSPP